MQRTVSDHISNFTLSSLTVAVRDTDINLGPQRFFFRERRTVIWNPVLRCVNMCKYTRHIPGA